MTRKKIEAKIREIKAGKTTLEIERQKITVDSDCLPAKIIQDSKLKLYFLDSETIIATNKQLAKMILEEILNGK